MSARDAEDMANAMLLDFPLPNIERSDERHPEDGGSGKLPEEEQVGEKLPEGGDKKLPKETPAGKLVPSCTKKVPFFALNLIKYHIFFVSFPRSREYCGDGSRCAGESHL